MTYDVPHSETRQKMAKTPCSSCPLRRKSMPGYLGGSSATGYVEAMQSDHNIACHSSPGYGVNDAARMRPCAGVAIYRRNINKIPRDGSALKAVEQSVSDSVTVFSNAEQFYDHHKFADTWTTDLKG